MSGLQKSEVSSYFRLVGWVGAWPSTSEPPTHEDSQSLTEPRRLPRSNDPPYAWRHSVDHSLGVKVRNWSVNSLPATCGVTWQVGRPEVPPTGDLLVRAALSALDPPSCRRALAATERWATDPRKRSPRDRRLGEVEGGSESLVGEGQCRRSRFSPTAES